jgi:hypothetical protein
MEWNEDHGLEVIWGQMMRGHDEDQWMDQVFGWKDGTEELEMGPFDDGHSCVLICWS